MKARKDIAAVMKVFELRVNSGETNGLNINLKAYEFVEMQKRISLNSSSRLMANAWHLPN